MSSALSTTQATGNLFLDNLPIAVLDALRPTLTKIALRGGRVISDRDEAMDVVVFPVSSILSVVLEMSDGDTAEVGIMVHLKHRQAMSCASTALFHQYIPRR